MACEILGIHSLRVADTMSCAYEGMPTDPVSFSADELSRSHTLHSSNLLKDRELADDINVYCAMAARMAKTAKSSVCLLDTQHLFVVAAVGMCIDPMPVIPRTTTLCHHLVSQKKEFMEVLDTEKDPRFIGNENCKALSMRYYLSTPVMLQGMIIGTLCVIDDKPRNSSNTTIINNLIDLAALLSQYLEERTRLNMKSEIDSARLMVCIVQSLKPVLDSVLQEKRKMEVQVEAVRLHKQFVDNNPMECFGVYDLERAANVSRLNATLNSFRISLSQLSNAIETSLKLAMMSVHWRPMTGNSSHHATNHTSYQGSSANLYSQKSNVVSNEVQTKRQRPWRDPLPKLSPCVRPERAGSIDIPTDKKSRHYSRSRSGDESSRCNSLFSEDSSDGDSEEDEKSLSAWMLQLRDMLSLPIYYSPAVHRLRWSAAASCSDTTSPIHKYNMESELDVRETTVEPQLVFRTLRGDTMVEVEALGCIVNLFVSRALLKWRRVHVVFNCCSSDELPITVNPYDVVATDSMIRPPRNILPTEYLTVNIVCSQALTEDTLATASQLGYSADADPIFDEFVSPSASEDTAEHVSAILRMYCDDNGRSTLQFIQQCDLLVAKFILESFRGGIDYQVQHSSSKISIPFGGSNLNSERFRMWIPNRMLEETNCFR